MIQLNCFWPGLSEKGMRGIFERICDASDRDNGSVDYAECGKRGVWKMRSVENEECGECGVWKMRSVENGECGK